MLPALVKTKNQGSFLLGGRITAGSLSSHQADTGS